MRSGAKRFLERQPSWMALVGANLLATVLALALGWTLGDLLWTFYIQSLIIGWFARERMLALQHFSTEGFKANGKPVPEDESGKRSTANFFAMHFGGFHFGYLIFLFTMSMPDTLTDWLILLACGVAFWMAQRQTFDEQVAVDAQGRPNLGALMFLPYLRIIPIHLTIILGSVMGDAIGILFFMMLKTAADLGLDRLDRYLARKAMAATVTKGE